VGFSNTGWHFFESNILRSPAGLTVLLGQAKGRDAPPTDQDGTAKAITPVGRLVKFLIAVVFIIRHVMKSTRMTAAPFRRNCIMGSILSVFSSTLEYTLWASKDQ
jgi:hypothetical protein